MEGTQTPARRPAPGPYYFLVANLLYLVVVQGLSLTIQPVGRDFSVFAGLSEHPGAWLIPPVEVAFGDRVALYHLLNLVLLYGTMVCMFLLTRLLIQGPWWLGSLTAALLMAHPLKSEAIYHTSGILDMAPAFLAVLSLTLYAYFAKYRSKAACVGATLAYAVAALCFPQTWGILLVIVAFEGIATPPESRSWLRVAPFALIGLAAPFVGAAPAGWWQHNPLEALTPLYFVFYPIGLLPETEHLFLAQPILWGAAFLLIAAVTLAIAWGAQSRVVWFGLVAAVLFRLFPAQPVDLVHMNGGGQMFVPIVLLNLALAALCWRIMQHRKWVRTVVLLTTVLCIVFFALQLRELFGWRHAAQQALAYQARARLATEAVPGTTLAIAPDLGYHRTAPVQLREAVDYDGRFSVAYPAVPLFTLRYSTPGRLKTEVLEQEPGRWRLKVHGATPASALPRDFPDTLPEGTSVAVVETDDGFSIRLEVDADGPALPTIAIPYRNGLGMP